MNYITLPFLLLLCSACLEGKDSYENMHDYMQLINGLLEGRQLSTGAMFILWLGGKLYFCNCFA